MSVKGSPAIRTGWLQKRSREGIIKNWKRRFVVLDVGVLKYFEARTDIADYKKISYIYLYV